MQLAADDPPDGADVELDGAELVGVEAADEGLVAGEEPPLELEEQAASARAEAARATGRRS